MVGVRKSFGPTIALAGVDLEVSSGANQQNAGEIFLAGEPFRPRRPLDARRAGVAMIYQELSLAKDLSVMENILLGMEPTLGPLLDWRQIRRSARKALATLG